MDMTTDERPQVDDHRHVGHRLGGRFDLPPPFECCASPRLLFICGLLRRVSACLLALPATSRPGATRTEASRLGGRASRPAARLGCRTALIRFSALLRRSASLGRLDILVLEPGPFPRWFIQWRASIIQNYTVCIRQISLYSFIQSRYTEPLYM